MYNFLLSHYMIITLDTISLLINLFYSLLRYNIIDTTISSATEARKLIKEHWDNVINTIERFLTSNPDTTQLDSASASVSSSSDRGTDQDTEQDTYQDTKQDGNAKEVEQYLTKISKEVVSSIIFKGIGLIFVESSVVLIQIVYISLE